MKILVACEYSGRVRAAFHARGHFAVSCDMLPSEEPWHGFNPWHYEGDVLELLARRARPFYARLNDVEWDMMIAHPPCTYLTNSGVRWMDPERFRLMESAADFYAALWDTPIPKVCIENPVMHGYGIRAIERRIGKIPRQFVQPWYFGEPMFKRTGYALRGLPQLQDTDRLVPPRKGTQEYKDWSWVHRVSPGPDRWKIRSRTPVGIAQAMAAQWGARGI